MAYSADTNRVKTSLYLVPTPIGNLEDMTYRAVRILSEVDVIWAEDTRNSRVLLDHYGIRTPMKSYHAFNEHKIVTELTARMSAGEVFALISDAGMPVVSDPGFLLTREATTAGLQVEALPGPTAFLPALIKSCLPADRFTFEGFLPHKKGRNSKLNELADEERTFILYESPYRIVKTLKQLAEVCGSDREASVSRELTKLHEETLNGTLDELAAHFDALPKIKGEFVLTVAGKK